MLVEFVLQVIEDQVLRDDGIGDGLVAAHQGRNRLRDDAFGMAAHFRYLAGYQPQVLVERCNRVIRHGPAFPI